MGTAIGPCPQAACPPLSIAAAATGETSVEVTVLGGGPADITVGGQTAYGVVAVHTFTFLNPGTTYPVEAVSACGNRAAAVTRTAATPVDIVYCPSVRLDTGDCASCGAYGEAGYAYRDNALRDPAATVALPHCNGDVFYAYPAAGVYGAVRAEVPYYNGGATVFAYLANQSDCAPTESLSITNLFNPQVTVEPPVNEITLPAPNVVAHAFTADGQLTSTLSDGTTVVSNPIPPTC